MFVFIFMCVCGLVTLIDSMGRWVLFCRTMADGIPVFVHDTGFNQRLLIRIREHFGSGGCYRHRVAGTVSSRIHPQNPPHCIIIIIIININIIY